MNPSPHWETGGIDALRKKRTQSIGEIIEPFVNKHLERVKDFPDGPPPEKEKETDPKEQLQTLWNDIRFSANAFSQQEGQRPYVWTQAAKGMATKLMYHFLGMGDHRPNKGALIVGKPGLGKTMLMKIFSFVLKNGSIANEKAFRLRSVESLCNEYETLRKNDEKRKEFFNNYGRRLSDYQKELDHNHMCIDDIGKECFPVPLFSYKDNPIISILNARHKIQKNKIITHATTNFELDELVEFYGSPLVDRFYQMFHILHMEGQSFRRL